MLLLLFFLSLSLSLSPLKIRDLCYQIIRAQSNQFLPLFTTRLINLIWGTLLTQKENILIWEKLSARKCVYCWSRITKKLCTRIFSKYKFEYWALWDGVKGWWFWFVWILKRPWECCVLQPVNNQCVKKMVSYYDLWKLLVFEHLWIWVIWTWVSSSS